MHDELARYRNLCERVRAFWMGQGMAFSCPPATEEQLRRTEEQLGHPLPPLLRMLYGEVANGGNGLIWYDIQFPLIGAYGGCHSPPVWKSNDGQWSSGLTIEQFISRSGWRLHSCIEAALRKHPGRYVICSDLPDGFVTIVDTGPQGYALDLVSGCVYETWFYGDLPLDDNQIEPLLELSFAYSSLEELVEEFLSHVGCGNGSANRATRSPREKGEFTPDALDESCEADSATVWRGLYRGVQDIVNPQEPGRE